MGDAADPTPSFVIAEYAALRSEIDNRSNHQHLLVNLAATGSAALLAVGAARDTFIDEVLLVVPPFVLTLFVLYVDHWMAISRIGGYLRTDLRNVATRAGGAPGVFAWEEVSAKPPSTFDKAWRHISGGVFAGIAIASSFVAMFTIDADGWRAMAALEFAVGTVSLIAWRREVAARSAV